ncbi:uncharacterized protein LOC133183982 [Saccostrea echinata]|uniref:uncharacterized protein LOC133183982 n=1 Tax=Saccostrea echinata TaxID=191078 RepID=UPI002A810095|nr:uncharacterized protein LOC133183982 [Saccostrea echinata]
MVHKTTKCGVHSGNTLRASHSKYTKTYRKQSCLVRKVKNSTNLRLLQDFGIATDDVAYSLSKKGRWVLPTVLKEHILLGGFSEEGPNVQLTEKHKLRKTANCLGFYASKGPTRKAVPSKKRYFNVSSVKKEPQLPSKEKEEVTEDKAVNECLEPEINVEIFLPTPITSSLTHNQKYIRPLHDTDVQLNTKKQKRKRRHRMQLKFDVVDSYEDDIWKEEEEIDSYDDELFQPEYQRPQSFFTATDVLKSAQKTKQIFEKSTKKMNHKHSEDERNKKGNLVYVDEPYPTSQLKETIENKTNIPDPGQLRSQRVMLPRKVILPTEETRPEFLKFIYGKGYMECKTFPRTFMIDITDEVKSVMKQNARMMYKAFCMDLTTVLIFTYDIYTASSDGEEVFDVFINLNIDSEVIELATLFDFYTGSMESVIGQAVSQVKSYSEEQFAKLKHYPKGNSEIAFDALNAGTARSNISTLTEEDVFTETVLNNRDRNESSEQLGLGFEALPPEICYICFEAMNENRPGIAMECCGHWFCRSCWREHLKQQNFSKLLCPEFDCEKEVDFTLILQVLNITDVRKYLIRQKETLVQSQCKYCPNEKCGRVLSPSLTSSKQYNAICECGTKFCPACFKFPHWPAPCEISLEYWNLLKEKGVDVKFNTEDFSSAEVKVRGKNCPKCHQFIEKQGGCYSMTCVCGTNFCWGCRGIYGVNHKESDLCSQWKHGDLFRTTKKRIATDPLLSLKMKTEPELIQFAVNQRAERANSKTLLMKRKTHYLCLRIRTLGWKSFAKAAGLLERYQSNETNILSKFKDFLRDMIKLYLEMRHLAEYTAVFAKQQNLRSQKSLNYVTERMDELASQIYVEFQRDVSADLTCFIDRMLYIKKHCMHTVSGLVKIIDEKNLS